MENKLKTTESQLHALESYDRRNNLEFEGIPSDIKDEDLEKTVIGICGSIGVDISDNDIEDCHRLGKNDPKKIICRLVNRKKCKETLLNKRLLKNTDKTKFGFPASTIIFVNENKSPYFNHLAYRCRVLKTENKIHSHSFSKGKLYLQRTIG